MMEPESDKNNFNWASFEKFALNLCKEISTTRETATFFKSVDEKFAIEACELQRQKEVAEAMLQNGKHGFEVERTNLQGVIKTQKDTIERQKNELCHALAQADLDKENHQQDLGLLHQKLIEAQCELQMRHDIDQGREDKLKMLEERCDEILAGCQYFMEALNASTLKLSHLESSFADVRQRVDEQEALKNHFKRTAELAHDQLAKCVVPFENFNELGNQSSHDHVEQGLHEKLLAQRVSELEKMLAEAHAQTSQHRLQLVAALGQVEATNALLVQWQHDGPELIDQKLQADAAAEKANVAFKQLCLVHEDLCARELALQTKLKDDESEFTAALQKKADAVMASEQLLLEKTELIAKCQEEIESIRRLAANAEQALEEIKVNHRLEVDGLLQRLDLNAREANKMQLENKTLLSESTQRVADIQNELDVAKLELTALQQQFGKLREDLQAKGEMLDSVTASSLEESVRVRLKHKAELDDLNELLSTERRLQHQRDLQLSVSSASISGPKSNASTQTRIVNVTQDVVGTVTKGTPATVMSVSKRPVDQLRSENYAEAAKTDRTPDVVPAFPECSLGALNRLPRSIPQRNDAKRVKFAIHSDSDDEPLMKQPKSKSTQPPHKAKPNSAAIFEFEDSPGDHRVKSSTILTAKPPLKTALNMSSSKPKHVYHSAQPMARDELTQQSQQQTRSVRKADEENKPLTPPGAIQLQRSSKLAAIQRLKAITTFDDDGQINGQQQSEHETNDQAASNLKPSVSVEPGSRINAPAESNPAQQKIGSLQSQNDVQSSSISQSDRLDLQPKASHHAVTANIPEAPEVECPRQPAGRPVETEGDLVQLPVAALLPRVPQDNGPTQSGWTHSTAHADAAIPPTFDKRVIMTADSFIQSAPPPQVLNAIDYQSLAPATDMTKSQHIIQHTLVPTDCASVLPESIMIVAPSKLPVAMDQSDQHSHSRLETNTTLPTSAALLADSGCGTENQSSSCLLVLQANGVGSRSVDSLLVTVGSEPECSYGRQPESPRSHLRTGIKPDSVIHTGANAANQKNAHNQLQADQAEGSAISKPLSPHAIHSFGAATHTSSSTLGLNLMLESEPPATTISLTAPVATGMTTPVRIRALEGASSQPATSNATGSRAKKPRAELRSPQREVYSQFLPSDFPPEGSVSFSFQAFFNATCAPAPESAVEFNMPP